MGLNVHPNYSDEIDNLIERFPCFDYLNHIEFPIYGDIKWNMTNDKFGLKDVDGYAVQVMFIGKTGYGKSTTLNRIVGKDVFDTDDISSCTKELFSADCDSCYLLCNGICKG